MEIYQCFNDDAVRIMVAMGRHGMGEGTWMVTVTCNKDTHEPVRIDVSNVYGYKEGRRLSWVIPEEEPAP